MIKDLKNTKQRKKTWDFGRFSFGRDYRYGWNPNGSTGISLECPVPSCKFGGFAKFFDGYGPALKERLITRMDIMMLLLLPAGIGLIGTMVKKR